MKVTYIHHSSFLIDTSTCYYLFDYEKGNLPDLDTEKPILVLASHGHQDHYNKNIFPILKEKGMEKIYAVLSDDIVWDDSLSGHLADAPLLVKAGQEYTLVFGQKLTAYQSTDLGVAFLIEEADGIFYHAGDLHDWVWLEETDDYNQQMTKDYHQQIQLLADKLKGRPLDLAFSVLDPRQEREDYDQGMLYFLEHIPVKKVYPMHYWEMPELISWFLADYPQYKDVIMMTEKYK